MEPPRTTPRDSERLSRERQKLRAQVSAALNEDDDPLAVYDQFVQWTLNNYGENDPESGLLDLLEEATTMFKDDGTYKTDLRYLKLWSLFARQIDRPAALSIYAFLVRNEIGTRYSVLYEEYASILESEGRGPEAEDIYRMGIKRQVRPLERLKNSYRNFQSRSASSSTAPAPSAATAKFTDVRSNHNKSRRTVSVSASSTSVIPSNPVALSSSPESRYALMLAPPAPGKRPEKPRFDLSLLFTEGVEYSIQEARARSMGLLDKKWGPPPPSELTKFSSASFSAVPVDFNEDGQRSTRTMGLGRRKSLMAGGFAEPTVTINTKEALADVFGMYNSPEKTTKFAGLPGSKHAPLKKVDAITPVPPVRQTHAPENKNSVQTVKTPTPAFRPFIDENVNASRKENTTPAPAKFKAYVDADVKKTPFTTPRLALASKDPSVPRCEENIPTNSTDVIKLTTEDTNAENIFSKVFIPAHPLPLAPLRDVFTDTHGQPKAKPLSSHARAQSHHSVLSPPPASAEVFRAGATFADDNARTPFKVFSRPPEDESESGNILANGFTTFPDVKDPFKSIADEKADSAAGDIPTSTSTPQPFGTHTPSWSNTAVEISDQEEDQEQWDDSRYEDEHEAPEHYDAPSLNENGVGEYEEGESYREVPLGGRFGQFNVMTPITERTYEFTASTRSGFDGTPSGYLRHSAGDESRDDAHVLQQQDEHGAVEVAERLAAELKEDGDWDYDDEGEQPLQPFRLSSDSLSPKDDSRLAIIEEKTRTLSLLDTLTLTSMFKPPNPCNPFDPPIMATLLSLVSSDPLYHDLREKDANLLGALQRFSRKARKTSGNTTNTGRLDLASCFPVTLAGRKFNVLEMLGEGGFGMVFKARDVSSKQQQEDDDADEDTDDEDEDEEESSLVALKVVKPRNLWEYHVLRRLHSTLPPSLRRSVILPHALYAFRDESFLVMDLCPQGTLLNIVNNAGSAGVSQQGACLDEVLVMFFTIELLRLLEGMHSAGFIHGDLKIDNCLLRLEDVPGGASAWSSMYQPSGEGGWSHKGIKVIDFGRTIDTRLFPSGQRFIAEWPTDDRDCIEMREDKPWTFQTDYFGLVGIVYCMLFGKYIQANSVMTLAGSQRYKIATPFKRYWQTELWTRLFDVLLNPCPVRPDGQLPVCAELGLLRVEMETWLQGNCNRTSNTLKGLLKKVEVSCFVR